MNSPPCESVVPNGSPACARSLWKRPHAEGVCMSAPAGIIARLRACVNAQDGRVHHTVIGRRESIAPGGLLLVGSEPLTGIALALASATAFD